ncbi:efflux RND transporter permease subunit [Derxia gummosa]|uniref:Efflux RND transporter permease subunit n=1 Tax=Derxia gummosa DSM 723 TaxID=1121388 RepID=A0A8B6X3D2_9BURK|nr:efflux RND transporter permease subunit [Derxia gummosa]
MSAGPDKRPGGGFNLSRWALEHQSITAYLIVVLALAGLMSFFKLGQDEDPPFTFRSMVVSANWSGASAREMSEQVTDKLEEKLQETPYIDKIVSYARPGETIIIVNLKEETPPKEVPEIWYQVRKKISDMRYKLPAGIQGPNFNDEFGDVFGTIYALSADGFTHEELRRQADALRQEMLRVPDVAKVELFGVQDQKVFVEVSHRRFVQYGLSAQDVVAQIAAQNAVEPAGAVVTPTDDVQVRVSGAFASEDAIRELRLRANGNTVRLGDIATVSRGYVDPPTQSMRVNGKQVIGLGISMRKGGDIVQLGKSLAALEQRVTAALPVGIELVQVQDQPTVVIGSVDEFEHTLVEAVVIVLVVSFLALGLHTKPLRVDVWPGLVVALTIPIVLAVTFLFMGIFGIGLHKISLGALIIALGLLVDDAIIAVEMMVRKLEEGYSRMEAATFVWSHTAMPMLTGTLVTAAGFLPVGLAESMAGEYTFSIFAVTGLALVISWFAAVISTPWLGYHLLRTRSHVGSGEHHELFDTPFYRRFRALVDWCVNRRWIVIAATVASLVTGGVGFGFIEQQFFPDSTRRELMVDLYLPEGASYQQTEQVARDFEAWALKQEGVESVTSFVGVGAPRFYLPLDQILPQKQVAEIIVLPTDLKARARLRDLATRFVTEQLPEVRGRVRYLPSGPPVPYPVQFRIEGPDPDRVRAIAEQVKDVMRGNPDTLGINDNWNESIKTLRVEVDQDKARAAGVTSTDVARAANTALSGVTVGQLRDRNRLIDIVVRSPKEEREAIAAMAEVNIATPNGPVPISQLARIGFAWEPGVLFRQNRDWAITAQCDVRDGIQGNTVALALDPQMDALRASLPLGYRIVIAGALEQSDVAGKSIAAKLPLAVFVIFTLLMAQLHSFSRAVMIFLTGPLGFIGAAASLLLLRAPFGFVAQLGVIALVGMIIRNSVILVDQIEQDRAAGVDAWTAIVEAAVRRFRPIILTAAAAVLAMIPLSRSVFWGPMAVAIMGGLIVATALTLLFLPALYAAWFRVRRA